METPRSNRPFYELVRDELRQNVIAGNLPPGTLLPVAAVADRLKISRAPVNRALQLLSSEGLIERTSSQGYVVGSPDAPKRRNLHALTLDFSPALAPAAGRAIWQRIYEQVEDDVLSCTPFGTYQISEAALGDHFGVSRTVVRDVLGRMQSRNLIEKNARSHWIAGPLSARLLDEWHEVRIALEPRLLAAALPRLPRAMLVDMCDALAEAKQTGEPIEQGRVDELENDLHRRALETARNRRMAETVRQAQISLTIDRLFNNYIGVISIDEMLAEHRLVFDHLVLGDGQGAAVALEHHLAAEHIRSRARLKVLAVFTEPQIAPYLIPAG
jgi:DNA-binding GntR family transcriptional regulator